MAERYRKFFSLPDNLYAAGAPVIVKAGALLKDMQTGKVLAQLKLKNISLKPIKAVKVKVSPLDTVNRPLDGEISYEYLDLNIERDAEFGQKNAIFMSDVSARAFSVDVTEVDFADNSVWTTQGNVWETLPKLEPVGDHELTLQYKIYFGSKALYRAKVYKDVWQCACGGINGENEDKCHVCGNRLSELLAVDMNELNARKERRLAKAEAKSKDEMKINILLAIVLVIIIIIVSIALLYPLVLV